MILTLAGIMAAAAPMTVIAAPDPEVAPPPVAPVIPISAEISDSTESGMETALVAIKGLFDIDDDVYSDFSYSSSSSGSDKVEDMLWSFYWSDTRNAFIYATVAADGTVMQFRKFNGEQRNFGFAEIAKNEAIAAAGEIIQKANPGSYEYYKSPSAFSVSINDSEYRFSYFAEINGYSFPAAQISVSVNKFSGEITAYSTSNIDPGRYKFENADEIISESAAIEAYAAKIGLTLEYRSYFDYENNTVTVFPAYITDPAGIRFIDAVSGEIVEYAYDRGSDDGSFSANSAAEMSMAAMDAGTGGGSSGSRAAALSPAEISAIDRVSGFLTGEQALGKLLEAAELNSLDVDSFSERYISLNRDYRDRNRYIYDVMMYRYDDPSLTEGDIAYIYGRVDAESGRVLSFNLNYLWNYFPEGENNYSEEQAEAITDAFLKKIAPGEYAKSKKESNEQNYRGDAVYLQYIRYENGVPFRDNGITVSVSSFTGKITSYSLNWYDNEAFPDITGVLPEETALAGFAAQVGSSINYITIGDGNAALVYRLNSRNYIDPFTGSALDYSGAPWSDSTVTPEYGDVSGHWAENIVTRLVDNGVFLWSGSFEPEKTMTELEFLRYILLIESYYYPVDPIEYMSMRGISVAADADKILTRQEAARIIVEYLGYGKLAEQSEWFVYPFRDDVTEEYRGYITICYMLGIVNGSDGKFDASANITRAQAASILYNMILAKS